MTYTFLEAIKMIDDASELKTLDILTGILKEEKKEYSLVHLVTLFTFIKEKTSGLIEKKAMEFVEMFMPKYELVICQACSASNCPCNTHCIKCSCQL